MVPVLYCVIENPSVKMSWVRLLTDGGKSKKKTKKKKLIKAHLIGGDFAAKIILYVYLFMSVKKKKKKKKKNLRMRRSRRGWKGTDQNYSCSHHYENISIQIYWKFNHHENEKF